MDVHLIHLGDEWPKETEPSGSLSFGNRLEDLTRTQNLFFTDKLQRNRLVTEISDRYRDVCSLGPPHQWENRPDRFSPRVDVYASHSDRHGDVIFPGAAPINGKTEPILSRPEWSYTPLKRLWVAACVVYQSGFSPRIYHTKVWYLSSPRHGVKEPIPISPEVEDTWQPFDNFVPYGSEAD